MMLGVLLWCGISLSWVVTCSVSHLTLVLTNYFYVCTLLFPDVLFTHTHTPTSFALDAQLFLFLSVFVYSLTTAFLVIFHNQSYFLNSSSAACGKSLFWKSKQLKPLWYQNYSVAVYIYKIYHKLNKTNLHNLINKKLFEFVYTLL